MQRTHHLARALAQTRAQSALLYPERQRELPSGYTEMEPRLHLTADAGVMEELTESVILVQFNSLALRARGSLPLAQSWQHHHLYDYIDHINERITGVDLEIM